MKIGLFIGNMSPAEGGAYTLIVSQLKALGRISKSCGHEIVLLHNEQGCSLVEQFGEFKSLNVDAALLGVSNSQEIIELRRQQHLAAEERRLAAEQRRLAAEQRRLAAEQQRLAVEQERLAAEQQHAALLAMAQREWEAFDARRQKISRMSDFAGRLYASLYSPPKPESLPPPAAPVVRDPDSDSDPDPDSDPEPAPAPEPPLSFRLAGIFKREGIQFLIYLAPWFEALVMDIPFGIFLWDLQHRGNPWFPELGGNEWSRREQNYQEILRRAAIIYTGTERGREEVVTYYQVAPERIKILPFLVPGDIMETMQIAGQAASSSRLALPPSYLFYPAQFWAHKNHVLILEACKLIRERTGWDLAVVFTGADKGNQDHVRAYARSLGLEESVRFLGFVERADILELYRGAFCLAFPTFFGPDNLPPLEAFAMGCPVVASDVPGAREQLGQAAILVSPTDERAFAEAILSLRDEKTRARAVEAGLAMAAGMNWDDYAQRMIDPINEFTAIRRTWA